MAVSDGKNLLLFLGEDGVDLLHELVMNFLNLRLGVLLGILAEAFLDFLLQPLDGLAARVAHRYLGVLGLPLALLDKLLAAVLGKRGYA